MVLRLVSIRELLSVSETVIVLASSTGSEEGSADGSVLDSGWELLVVLESVFVSEPVSAVELFFGTGTESGSDSLLGAVLRAVSMINSVSEFVSETGAAVCSPDVPEPLLGSTDSGGVSPVPVPSPVSVDVPLSEPPVPVPSPVSVDIPPSEPPVPETSPVSVDVPLSEPPVPEPSPVSVDVPLSEPPVPVPSPVSVDVPPSEPPVPEPSPVSVDIPPSEPPVPEPSPVSVDVPLSEPPVPEPSPGSCSGFGPSSSSDTTYPDQFRAAASSALR